MRYLARDDDVELGRLRMQLCLLRANTMAVASGNPDPLGHHPVRWSRYVYAEFSSTAYQEGQD